MRAENVLFRCYSFEVDCADLDIEHRLTKPRHPWTNGQVKRMSPGATSWPRVSCSIKDYPLPAGKASARSERHVRMVPNLAFPPLPIVKTAIAGRQTSGRTIAS